MKLRISFTVAILTLVASACSLSTNPTPTNTAIDRTIISPDIAQPTTIRITASPLVSNTTVTTKINPTLEQGKTTPTPIAKTERDNHGEIRLLTSLDQNHLGQINQVLWHPQGETLLAQIGKNLQMIDTATWQILWSVPAGYSQLAFTPEGDQLLGLSGSQLFIIDPAAGIITKTSTLALKGGLTAITPDGHFIAETTGGAISLYDVQTGQNVRSLLTDLNSGAIADMAFSADNQWVVAGSVSGDQQIWQVETHSTVFHPAVIPSPVYECDVKGAIQGLPLGTLLIVCSYPADTYESVNYQVLIFQASSNPTNKGILIRDNTGRSFSDFTVNADHSRMAIMAEDEIEIWSTTGSFRTRLLPKTSAMGMTFNPTQNNTLAIWTKRAIQIWDIQSGELQSEWTVPGSSAPIEHIEFSPDSSRRLIVLARQTGMVELWNAGRVEKIYEWLAGPVSALAFSGDGVSLAVAQESGTITIFTMNSSRFTPQFEIQAGFRILDLTFNPNKPNQLLIVGDSHHVHAWDLTLKQEMIGWQGSNLFSLTGLAARGNTIAAGTIAGRIPVWRTTGSDPFAELSFSSLSPIEFIAISTDENQVIFAQDNTVQAWQLSPRMLIQKRAYKNPVRILLSPDGCNLAVESGSNIEILASEQFTVMAQVESPSALTGAMAYSTDNRLLAAGNENGELLLFGIPGTLELQPELPADHICGPVKPLPTITPIQMPAVIATPSFTRIPPIATQASSPPIFTRTLSFSQPLMLGEDVLLVQKRLYELGYTEIGLPDGIFGKMTESAVRIFQLRNALDVDGYVGPITWKRLFSSDAIRAN